MLEQRPTALCLNGASKRACPNENCDGINGLDSALPRCCDADATLLAPCAGFLGEAEQVGHYETFLLRNYHSSFGVLREITIMQEVQL